jgi:hypothetical protein
MKSKIDPDRLRKMWLAGAPSNEIASVFGVQYPAVNRAAKALGLPSRGKGGPRPAQPPEVAPVSTPEAKPERVPRTLQDAVMVLGGTHAGRATLARRFGVTIRRVEQEWHKCRA